MKFELVGHYPLTDKNRGSLKENQLGTVHIYIVDYKIDIRGIRVHKAGKGIFFNFPHITSKDPDTGEGVKYPVFRLSDEKEHKELMDFLHQKVKPEVIAWVKANKWPSDERSRPPAHKNGLGGVMAGLTTQKPVLRRIIPR